MITIENVKKVHEITQAGMASCKDALEKCDGNIEKAIVFLKEKGLAELAAHAGRCAREGKVFITKTDEAYIVYSVNCETDFVANSAEFNQLANITDKETLLQKIDDLKVGMRENITLKDFQVINFDPNDICASYIHYDNKTASVILLESESSKEINNFAYDCCLHLVAYEPAYITRDDISLSFIDEQTNIAASQIDEQKKFSNDEIRNKVIAGKVDKLLCTLCFVDQPFVKDQKKTVSQKLNEYNCKLKKALIFTI